VFANTRRSVHCIRTEIPYFVSSQLPVISLCRALPGGCTRMGGHETAARATPNRRRSLFSCGLSACCLVSRVPCFVPPRVLVLQRCSCSLCPRFSWAVRDASATAARRASSAPSTQTGAATPRNLRGTAPFPSAIPIGAPTKRCASSSTRTCRVSRGVSACTRAVPTATAAAGTRAYNPRTRGGSRAP